MGNGKFLYLRITVSDDKTVEDKVREVFRECEFHGWNIVAYDLNSHNSYDNEYLMTVYMEKEEYND